MDCIMFVNGWFGMKKRKNLKVPYYAARMINKQMNATWLFAGVHCKKPNIHDEEQEDEDEDEEVQVDNDEEEEDDDDGDQLIIKERVKEKLASIPGMFVPFLENSARFYCLLRFGSPTWTSEML